MPLNNTRLENCLNDTDEETKCILHNLLYLNLVSSESSEKIIISSINKLLSNAKTRAKGLEFLNIILDNCSKDVIVLNAISWVNFCVIRYQEDSLQEAKLSVIAKIIENAHTESDFSKKFLSDYVSKICENCINTFHITNSYCEIALATLTTCMKYYPSWFGAQKDKIEVFLVNFLDCKSDIIVEKAAIAFHYLQQVGGAGLEGINHKTNFTKSFEKVCFTIHKLFSEFFVNEREFYHHEINIDDSNVFSFKESSAYNSSQKMLHIVARRLNNCFKFLEVLMKSKFSVVKEIKPKELLTVISRGLTMHHCLTSSSAEHTVENYSFSLLLNEIQMKLMKILRLFIIWYRSNLLPFSFTVTKTLIDTLNKTQSCNCFKSDCLYQEAVYKTLNTWLKICKSSFHVHFQNQVLLRILKDVAPTKSEVTLNINVNLNKSSKARKKAINESIMSVNTQKPTENIKTLTAVNDENRCHLGLVTLKTLLFCTEIKVKLDLLKAVYSTIFTTLNDIQTSNIPHPYTHAKCQIALYEVVVALFEQNTLKTLPPLQLTLNALKQGQSSNNRFIAEICEKGINSLEKLCQPVCPSLYLSRGNKSEVNEKNKLNNGFGSQNSDYFGGESLSDIYNSKFPKYAEDDNNSSIKILDNHLINPPNHPDYSAEGMITENQTVEDMYDENPVTEEPIDVESIEETERDLAPTGDGLRKRDQSILYDGSEDVEMVEPTMKRSKTDDNDVDIGLEKLEINPKINETDGIINERNFNGPETDHIDEGESSSKTTLNIGYPPLYAEEREESINSLRVSSEIENLRIKKSSTSEEHEGSVITLKEVTEITVDAENDDDLGDTFEETVGKKGEEKLGSDDEGSISDGGFVDEVREDF